MLESRGRWLLATALALVAAGLGLGMAGPVLAGVVLLAGLLLELERLRAALPAGGGGRAWGVVANLQVDRASGDERSVTAHRVGHEIELRLQLEVPAAFDGVRVFLRNWQVSPGLEVDQGLRSLVLRDGVAAAHVRTLPQVASVHRILGIEARLVDAMGLMSAAVFLPCPCELAVLPRSLPLDLKQVAETRRRSPRSSRGQRPDKTPGLGDDLRELREHLPGDPFKHIAWKASAQRGRLMSRTFEREQTRAMYAVLDTGATMREGLIGASSLDQALDLVHSLAEVCAKSHAPFGLALVDGRVVDRRPVLEGLAALRDTDRALLDVRRQVAEDLTPLTDDELQQAVASYLTAVEGLDLPAPGSAPAGVQAWRQRLVMAALARLPERERLPMLRGPEPSSRADRAILRRFCRAMDLPLPYRSALDPAQRVAGLVAGVQAAAAARKGPFVIAVVSDFRRLAGTTAPLWQACARARLGGHRVVAISLRDAAPADLTLELARDAEEVDLVRGLVHADHAARSELHDELRDGAKRAGAHFLADPSARELVAMLRA